MGSRNKGGRRSVPCMTRVLPSRVCTLDGTLLPAQHHRTEIQLDLLGTERARTKITIQAAGNGFGLAANQKYGRIQPIRAEVESREADGLPNQGTNLRLTQLPDVDPVHAWAQALLKQGDFLKARIHKQMDGLILEHDRHQDAFCLKKWNLEGAIPC